MIFTETKLKGAFIIDLKPIEDERGFFSRTFCVNEFNEFGLTSGIKQANSSYNKKKATLRGMHMQLAPYEEAKIVKCTRGSVFDVIVDLRPSSDTYKQWIGVELTAVNYRSLFVPEGFAHGYLTLEDHTDVTYLVTQEYAPGFERGYRWDDPEFNITWPVIPEIVSPKDRAHPLFIDLRITNQLV